MGYLVMHCLISKHFLTALTLLSFNVLKEHPLYYFNSWNLLNGYTHHVINFNHWSMWNLNVWIIAVVGCDKYYMWVNNLLFKSSLYHCWYSWINYANIFEYDLKFWIFLCMRYRYICIPFKMIITSSVNANYYSLSLVTFLAFQFNIYKYTYPLLIFLVWV